MSWALLGLCVLLAGLVSFLVVKSLASKDGQLADREKRIEEEERADHALSERDLAVVQLAAERTKASDLMLAKSQVESERNALARKVADLETKLASALPVSDEGAAAVNAGFAEPLLPGDALEKP